MDPSQINEQLDLFTVTNHGEITSRNTVTIVHTTDFENYLSTNYIFDSRKAGCAMRPFQRPPS